MRTFLSIKILWIAEIIREAMNIMRIYQYPLSKVLTPTIPAPTPARNEPNPSSLFRSHLMPHLISLRARVDELRKTTIVKVYLLNELKKCYFPFSRALALFINWKIELMIRPYFTVFKVCNTALEMHPCSCLQKGFLLSQISRSF